MTSDDSLFSNKTSPSLIEENSKTGINLKTDKPGNTLVITEFSKIISEVELMKLFEQHGSVSQVFISNNGFILIDFVNANSASELLYTSKITPFKIDGNVAKLSFSCQTVDEYKSLARPNVSRSNSTKVLHFLITNVTYTVNVDILNKICSPHGKIIRIYIGKKNVKDNSIEALIEFASLKDAQSVKSNLDGNDIYSNCCSLTVSYSKIYRIFVEKNDSESYDYNMVTKPGLLGPPPDEITTAGNLQGYNCNSQSISSHDNYPSTTMPSYERKPQSSSFIFYKSDATIQETVEGVVIQCRNFSSKITADNLFNLFCLYGNVEKIKLTEITRNKSTNDSNVAFVQMSNHEGASFCIEMLNGMRIFNKVIEITVTTLTQLTENSPNNDPIHTYYNDFNNRFKSNFQGKSRVFFPSQTLHFFNVPYNFRAEEIADVFVSAKVKDPSKVVIFPKKSGSHLRGSLVTGLIEFDSLEEAVEGVLMVNHTRLLLPQVSHPFHIKLAFSPAKILEQHIKPTLESNEHLEPVRPQKVTKEAEVECDRSKRARIV